MTWKADGGADDSSSKYRLNYSKQYLSITFPVEFALSPKELIPIISLPKRTKPEVRTPFEQTTHTNCLQCVVC
jgi:hypothetical protein